MKNNIVACTLLFLTCFTGFSQISVKFKPQAPFSIYKNVSSETFGTITEPEFRNDNIKSLKITYASLQGYVDEMLRKNESKSYYYDKTGNLTSFKNINFTLQKKQLPGNTTIIEMFTGNNTIKKEIHILKESETQERQAHHYYTAGTNSSIYQRKEYIIIQRDPLRTYAAKYDIDGKLIAAIDSVFYAGRKPRSISFLNKNNTLVWQENYNYSNTNNIQQTEILYPFKVKYKELQTVNGSNLTCELHFKENGIWRIIQRVTRSNFAGNIRVVEEWERTKTTGLENYSLKTYETLENENLLQMIGSPQLLDIRKNKILNYSNNFSINPDVTTYHYNYFNDGTLSNVVGNRINGNTLNMSLFYSKERVFWE